MKIDWDKLRTMLPVYAYEYETQGETVDNIDYWYPHKAGNSGQTPPPGWTSVSYDESYENLMKALSDYVKLQPTEKAVWFNNATGEFSATWPFVWDTAIQDAIEFAKGKPEWKLIVYRCETDENFEFMGLMKVVTNVKEKKDKGAKK